MLNAVDRESKKCSLCGIIKPMKEYNLHKTGRQLGRPTTGICRECTKTTSHEYYLKNKEKILAKERARYYSNGGKSMQDNPMCTSYLGTVIAERALSNFFDNMQRMPTCNEGYDFICGKNFKIDVKSACLHKNKHSASNWVFHIDKNVIADYFLCLAFDNRSDLNHLHIWLIPGNAVNQKIGLSISNLPSSFEKWKQYERDLRRIQT